jgi:hypothetical protein
MEAFCVACFREHNPEHASWLRADGVPHFPLQQTRNALRGDHAQSKINGCLDLILLRRKPPCPSP